MFYEKWGFYHTLMQDIYFSQFQINKKVFYFQSLNFCSEFLKNSYVLSKNKNLFIFYIVLKEICRSSAK